ncbi:PD40 domain-containing protein [Nocardioides lijunqiniae]|uniref:PD40 domain-containing protein n=1 Tax=Nocardioides lijunqiniae TaxID=2760832 RepID=UPI001877D05A|nr:PD40 domain-containing protein [Nocardioides lijunqiniae]
MSRTTQALVAGVVALTALGAAPGPSSAHVPGSGAGASRTGTAAGTIVFIRSHDVWIARGDGSGARPLTHDGTAAFPYGSPTQSDAGTVVATHVQDLVRMTQHGRVLNRLNPGSLPTSMGTRIDGMPVDAAISPDGRRIAYTFTRHLGPGTGFRSATGYTAADRLTDPAPHATTFFWDPSWVGNGRTLQHGGAGSHVNLHDLGSAPEHWFGASTGDFDDTELSRDGRLLAGIFADGGPPSLVWFAVSGDARSGPPPAAPDLLCQVGPVSGITHPTWAPDSESLAWQESDGIWTRSGARDCSVPSRLVLPGGSEPHWSPATLTAPAPVALRSTRRPAISGKAVVGRTLRARPGAWNVPGAQVVLQWLRGGKVVGRGAAHRVARRDRGRVLTVRATARKAGHGSATATSRPVRVRR